MPEITNNTDPKHRLWENLKTKGLYTKSFEDFNAQFSSPDKINKLYQGLSNQGLYTKTPEEFESQFFSDLKKKPVPVPADAGGAGFSPTYTPSADALAEQGVRDTNSVTLPAYPEDDTAGFGDHLVRPAKEVFTRNLPQGVLAKQASTTKDQALFYKDQLESILNTPEGETVVLPQQNTSASGFSMPLIMKAGAARSLLLDRMEERAATSNEALADAIKIARQHNPDEKQLIQSLSQIDGPADFAKFVLGSMSQSVAQIPLTIGTFGTSTFLQEYGDVYINSIIRLAEQKGITPQEVIDQGLDDDTTATYAAGLASALDYIGAKKVLGVVGADKILKNYALKTLNASLVEGATEAGQSAITQTGEDIAADSDITISGQQLLDEAAAGFFGAGGTTVLGTAGRKGIEIAIRQPKGDLGTKPTAKEVEEEVNPALDKVDQAVERTGFLAGVDESPVAEEIDEVVDEVVAETDEDIVTSIRRSRGEIVEEEQEAAAEEQVKVQEEAKKKTSKLKDEKAKLKDKKQNLKKADKTTSNEEKRIDERIEEIDEELFQIAEPQAPVEDKGSFFDEVESTEFNEQKPNVNSTTTTPITVAETAPEVTEEPVQEEPVVEVKPKPKTTRQRKQARAKKVPETKPTPKVELTPVVEEKVAETVTPEVKKPKKEAVKPDVVEEVFAEPVEQAVEPTVEELNDQYKQEKDSLIDEYKVLVGAKRVNQEIANRTVLELKKLVKDTKSEIASKKRKETPVQKRIKEVEDFYADPEIANTRELNVVRKAKEISNKLDKAKQLTPEEGIEVRKQLKELRDKTMATDVLGVISKIEEQLNTKSDKKAEDKVKADKKKAKDSVDRAKEKAEKDIEKVASELFKAKSKEARLRKDARTTKKVTKSTTSGIAEAVANVEEYQNKLNDIIAKYEEESGANITQKQRDNLQTYGTFKSPEDEIADVLRSPADYGVNFDYSIFGDESAASILSNGGYISSKPRRVDTSILNTASGYGYSSLLRKILNEVNSLRNKMGLSPVELYLVDKVTNKTKEGPYSGSPIGGVHFVHKGRSIIVVSRIEASEILKTGAHEGIHSIAYILYHIGVNSGIPQIEAHVTRINQIFKKLKQYTSKDGLTSDDIYGLTNASEMVAEAFSDPEFIELMSSYKGNRTGLSGTKNLFSEIIAAIKSMLNAFKRLFVGNEVEFSLHDEITGVMDDLLTYSQNISKEEARDKGLIRQIKRDTIADFSQDNSIRIDEAIERNNGHGLHLTPKGRPSKLYNDLLTITKSTDLAVQFKANIYSSNFTAWFGDWVNNPSNSSKAVDINGEPLIVWHGSENVFNKFSVNKLGKATGSPSATLGFFFGSSRVNSGNYVSIGKSLNEISIEEASKTMSSEELSLFLKNKTLFKKTEQLLKEYETTDALLLKYNNELKQLKNKPQTFLAKLIELINKLILRNEIDTAYKIQLLADKVSDLITKRLNIQLGMMDIPGEVFSIIENAKIRARAEEGSNNLEKVRPFFLNIRAAHITDDKGSRSQDVSFFERVKKAKENGYTGAIIKNTEDPLPTDVYAVFAPNQIKSVFNKGTFRSGTDNINFYAPKKGKSVRTVTKDIIEKIVDRAIDRDITTEEDFKAYVNKLDMDLRESGSVSFTSLDKAALTKRFNSLTNPSKVNIDDLKKKAKVVENLAIYQTQELYRDAFDTLMEVEYDKLSPKQKKQYRQILLNAAETGSLRGAGNIITNHKAQDKIELLSKLSPEVLKVMPDKAYFVLNPSQLVTFLSKWDKETARIIDEVFFTDIKKSIGDARKLREDIESKEIYDLFKKHKIDYVSDKRVQFYSLIRRMDGDKANLQIDSPEWIRQVNINIANEIAALNDKMNAVKTKQYTRESVDTIQEEIDIFNSLVRDIDQKGWDKSLTTGERAFRDKLMEIYDRFKTAALLNAEIYRNKSFAEAGEYVTDLSVGKLNVTDSPKIDDVYNQLITGDTKNYYGRIYTAESKFSKLRTKPKGVYYNYSAITNLSAYLEKQLIDIYATKHVKVSDNIINTSSNKVIKHIGAVNRSAIKKSLESNLKTAIGVYHNYWKPVKLLEQAKNEWMTTLLGNVTQVVNQTLPMAIKLAVTTGPEHTLQACAVAREMTKPDNKYGISYDDFVSKMGITIQRRDALQDRYEDVAMRNARLSSKSGSKAGRWLKEKSIAGQKLTTQALITGDKNIARIGFIAEFLRNGGDLSNLDSEKSKKAAITADRMVEMMQGTSNLDFAAALFKPTNTIHRVLLTICYTLKTFAFQEAMNTITSGATAVGRLGKDKEMNRFFIGQIAAFLTYRAAQIYIIGNAWSLLAKLTVGAASAIAGNGFKFEWDDEDEEDKVSYSNVDKILSESFLDVATGVMPAPVEAGVRLGKREWVDKWMYNAMMRDELGREYNAIKDSPTYAPFNASSGISEGIGGYGFAWDGFSGLMHTVDKSLDGEDVNVYDYHTREAWLSLWAVAPFIPLPKGDLMKLQREIFKEVKKQAEEGTGSATTSTSQNRRRSTQRRRNTQR